MRIAKRQVANQMEKAYTWAIKKEGDRPMRIAICDDEAMHRDGLKAVLTSCATLPEDADVSEFPNGESLLEQNAKRPFDIVFLDIEMDGISGMETGKRLRNMDRNVIMIFLTNHKKYVFKSFSIEPFDYLLKPVDNDRINKVLGRAVRKYREQHYIVDIKWQNETYALKVGDIVYLESDLRHIKFYTAKSMYMCIGKLDDYDHRLSPYGFLRCHKSFLVNMGFIKSIDDKSIKTVYGNVVLMSARKKQRCLDAFNEYIAKYRV